MNTSTHDSNLIVVHDIPPYLRVYKDGSVERLVATETTPPSLDPQTGVESKDVVFEPENGLKARLYRPSTLAQNMNSDKKHKLVPLVIYFHGGAFMVASISEPKYHTSLNRLVQESNIILVSIDYRLAPEHPLPTSYDDSWAALKWIGSHKSADHRGGCNYEEWINEYADFDRVYLAGDSAGANISHHMALKLGSDDDDNLTHFINIKGMVMIHPYFWGEKPIGVESENEFFKSLVDKWWLFVCPSDKGCDDPWINPFGAGEADDPTSNNTLVEKLGLTCERILVCVAGNDILRERGKLYYQKLVESHYKWKGKAELFESDGEDHVFHIFDPTSESSMKLIKRCAEFLNVD